MFCWIYFKVSCYAHEYVSFRLQITVIMLLRAYVAIFDKYKSFVSFKGILANSLYFKAQPSFRVIQIKLLLTSNKYKKVNLENKSWNH